MRDGGGSASLSTSCGTLADGAAVREPSDSSPVRPSELLTASEWGMIAGELRLSGRGLEIAQGFLDGLDERGVASRLGISEHTVHTFVKRIYQKCGVKCRAGLVGRLFVAYLVGTRRAVATMQTTACNLAS